MELQYHNYPLGFSIGATSNRNHKLPIYYHFTLTDSGIIGTGRTRGF